MRHHNPNLENRVAIAPYNFVPLPETVLTTPINAIPPHDSYTGHTGYFDCELETCSPTYVRGMQTVDQMAAESAAPSEPSSLDGGKTPFLPGSSLRGMVRTLMEIITYAKPGAVTKNQLVYRSVGDTSSQGEAYRNRLMATDPALKNHFTPKVKAGFMRQVGDKWYIQPAQEIGGTTFARIHRNDIPQGLARWAGCRNAHKIYIHPGPYKYQAVRGGFLHIKYAKVLRVNATESNGLQKAVLAQSGWMIKKNSETVVFGQPNKTDRKQDDWILVPDHETYEQSEGQTPDLVTAYKEQRSPEQRKLLGESGVLQDMQPVFYLMEKAEGQAEESLIFFGHTMMMRLPYQQAPYDLLPSELHDNERPVVDWVEAMFGYVDKKVPDDNLDGQTKNTARAGRLFFSDAVCLPGQGQLLQEELSPHILASPKPTTFQHYLTQRYPDDPKALYDYSHAGETTLRGFKLYWHKGSKPDIAETDEKKLKLDKAKVLSKRQYTTIQPIRPGVRFRFRLHFENLRAVELGALAWLLQIDKLGNYRFKLGMGKPLGMGAISLQAKLQLTERQTRYNSLFTDKGAWQLGQLSAEAIDQTEQEAIRAFEDMLLKNETINPGSVERLTQLPRLQMLLELLKWPGPDTELTRYMEIERVDRKAKRGKRNEYRNRPVLPDPLEVGQTVSGQAKLAPQAQQQTVTYSSPKTDASSALVDTDEVMQKLARRADDEAAKRRARKLAKLEREQAKRKKKKKKKK